jgi:hypothetical protein
MMFVLATFSKTSAGTTSSLRMSLNKSRGPKSGDLLKPRSMSEGESLKLSSGNLLHTAVRKEILHFL